MRVISRRLVSCALIAFALGAVGCGDSESKRVKHVILIVGDGMQLEHEIAASRYLSGSDNGLAFHSFPYKVPVSTWDVTTYDRYAYQAGAAKYSATSVKATIGYDPDQGGSQPFPSDTTGSSSYFLTPLQRSATDTAAAPATDSGSSATAWATGYKTDEGNLAWLPGDPDSGGNRSGNGSLKTIAELFRERLGAAIAVVSTVPFNHATPAAHVSHNKNRNNYYTGYRGYTGQGIADEIITVTKPEVVIGAGHNLNTNPAWDTTKGYMSQGLYQTLRSSTEYIFAERQAGADGSARMRQAAEQAVAQKKKLFGLFGGQSYYPDGSPADSDLFEPPVASHSPGSPRVSRATNENPLLAEAAVAALTVASQDPEGLFLMIEQGDIDWANHANNYGWMIGAMWDLNETVKAVMDFVNRGGDEVTWSNTLLIVTADHGNSYMRLSDSRKLGAGELPAQVYTPGVTTPGGYKVNWTYPGGDFTYGTSGHTNELVMLYAFGDAASRFSDYEGRWYSGRRIIDNTQIFQLITDVVGGVSDPSPVTVVSARDAFSLLFALGPHAREPFAARTAPRRGQNPFL